MTRYVGTAPLTVVRTASGSAAYVYAGDPVPSGVPAADIKRLSSEGYIEAVPEPEVPEVAPKDGPPARNG